MFGMRFGPSACKMALHECISSKLDPVYCSRTGRGDLRGYSSAGGRLLDELIFARIKSCEVRKMHSCAT